MNDSSIHNLPLPEYASTAAPTIAGLQDEVTRLYESRGIVVYRCVLAITRNAEESHDLTQEAVLRLYAELREGKQIRNSVEWVVAVARNLARDWSRSLKYRAPLADTTARLFRDQRPSPEQTAMEGNRQEIWMRVRSLLPPSERMCFELFVRGATFREISAKLVLPYRTVITRTRRATDKVRRLVAERRLGRIGLMSPDG